MVKPSFFSNERLAELEPLTRLLYIGLWTLADREGRLEDRPKRIRIEVLPYDIAYAEEVDQRLSALASNGFLIRYVSNSVAYIQIVNFAKHQRPHANEIPSIIPACADDSPKTQALVTKDASASLLNIDTRTLNLEPRTLSETSNLTIADAIDRVFELVAEDVPTDDGTAVEEEKRGPHKTSIPDEFEVSISMFVYAETKGLSPAQTLEETEHFVNYHRAKGTKHKDWEAAWKYWLRRAPEFARGKAPSAGSIAGAPLYDRHGNPTSAFFAKQAAELAADGD